MKELPLDKEQKALWKQWLKEKRYAPKVNVENHDTISMIALDQKGVMAVGSTTSGLAFKMHGRVGDAPIVGSGIFVEQGIGAAACTGLGEAVMRTCGAHSIVEAMRYGKSPQEACDLYIKRLIKQVPGSDHYQVGVIALDYSGRIGASSVQQGFTYAVGNSQGNTEHEAEANLKVRSDIDLAMLVYEKP